MSRNPWLFACAWLMLSAGACTAAFASEPPWTEIHVKHLFVITDAGEKRGREVALRLEQMRAVFGSLLMKSRLHMPVPLTVIALKNGQQYAEIAPLHQGQPNEPGFLLPGEDHQYIVLNAGADEPWRSVAGDFASALLNYNYPPTQDWFDEGFVEYFSSIWVTDKQGEIGGDPEPNSPNPFTEILKSAPWIPITDLLTAQPHNQGAQREIFSAESWMVIHYLLNKEKLPEAGTYFDLVQNQKMPTEQAVSKAFGVTPPQLEQAVKDYFHLLTSGAQATAGQAASRTTLVPPHQFPPSVGPDDIAMTVTQMPEADARALVADVTARIPEHHDRGVRQLQELANDPTNNETAHRALAWEKIQKKEFDSAAQELSAAAELNRRDIWIRYYLSALKYRMAQNTGQSIQGLANMIQDLRAVLDWYPEFAEAYNMLAMARVEGGGMNSALESIRVAIQLSPRNEQYVYNLGVVYASWKKWDAARAIFERLKSSNNPRLAAAASSQLQEMQVKQKYGIQAEKPAITAKDTSPKAPPESSPSSEEVQQNPEKSETENKPEPTPTTGPIQFVKGKLLSVDCSRPPVAVLTIVAGSKILKLRTPDYKSLTLVGADNFSCEWENRQVSINYRPSGKTSGDLVSLEVR